MWPRCSPIEQVIPAGTAAPLAELLRATYSREGVQNEVTWVLTNIADGTAEHTSAVGDSAAVPILVECLRSGSDEMKHLAVWALGNIAGCSPVFDLQKTSPRKMWWWRA